MMVPPEVSEFLAYIQKRQEEILGLSEMRFGSVVVVADESVPKDSVCLLNPRYKVERTENGTRELIDPEETAKASVIIKNVGGIE